MPTKAAKDVARALWQTIEENDLNAHDAEAYTADYLSTLEQALSDERGLVDRVDTILSLGPMPDKIGEEEAARMLEALRNYYRQPVMPLHKFCDGLKKWARAMADSNGMYKSVGLDGLAFFGTAWKSNLLYRILYLGEDPRTEKCPVHKGVWSGCVTEDPGCGCLSGANVTGWLAPDGEGKLPPLVKVKRVD